MGNISSKNIADNTSCKNKTIEALRFLFMCILCLWHCKDFAPWLHHGYLVVEFYFILSGFFLYESYLKHDYGVLTFTGKKIKRFFIPFMLSSIALMTLDRKRYLICQDVSPDGILYTYYSHIHEFFFCQGMGLTKNMPINHPLWYLSVLLFGGGILYSLLKNYHKKAISLFIPTFCMFGFAFILSNGNHTLQNSPILYGFQSWTIRGMAEMGLGIMTAYVFKNRYQQFYNYRHLIEFFAIIFLVGYILLFFAKDNYDYLSLFFIPVIICSSFLPSSFIDKMLYGKIWIKLGGLSLYMYFIHLFIAYIYWISSGFFIELKNLPPAIFTVTYLLLIILASMLLKQCSMFVSRKLKI